MSRIGKQPIPIPAGVDVTMKEGKVTVKGPKGQLAFSFRPEMDISVENKTVLVKRRNDERLSKNLHGLTRTLLANMIQGVTQGYAKKLEIHGVGYRAQVQGKKLQLSLGFSHPIEVTAPEGIAFEIDKEKKNLLTVSGIDKALVGQVAANIRTLRLPEPYKGKGIRYLGEAVRRKAGKAAATAAK